MLCMAYLLDHVHPIPSGWERQVKHCRLCAKWGAGTFGSIVSPGVNTASFSVRSQRAPMRLSSFIKPTVRRSPAENFDVIWPARLLPLVSLGYRGADGRTIWPKAPP